QRICSHVVWVLLGRHGVRSSLFLVSSFPGNELVEIEHDPCDGKPGRLFHAWSLWSRGRPGCIEFRFGFLELLALLLEHGLEHGQLGAGWRAAEAKSERVVEPSAVAGWGGQVG